MPSNLLTTRGSQNAPWSLSIGSFFSGVALCHSVPPQTPSSMGVGRRGGKSIKFVSRSACYRGPQPQKGPKWLGEGAKGVLTSSRDGLPRVSRTSATLFCANATLSWTSATGFWPTCTKTPFAPSPLLTTLGTFEVLDPCSRHSGSQCNMASWRFYNETVDMFGTKWVVVGFVALQK